MSTRIGGYSQGPYESLNLGNHVGDDPILVQNNREHHQQLIGNRPVYLKQVHKSDVVVLDPTTADDSQGGCLEALAGGGVQVHGVAKFVQGAQHRQGGAVLGGAAVVAIAGDDVVVLRLDAHGGVTQPR